MFPSVEIDESSFDNSLTKDFLILTTSNNSKTVKIDENSLNRKNNLHASFRGRDSIICENLDTTANESYNSDDSDLNDKQKSKNKSSKSKSKVQKNSSKILFFFNTK